MENSTHEQAALCVKQFEKARRGLKEFVEDNRDLFDTLMELIARYNHTNEVARDAVRQILPEGPIKIGAFMRKRAPVKEYYDPAALPGDILTIPGVIKQIDSRILQALVLEGAVDGRKTADALRSSIATAPVEGPKLISFDVT